LGCSNRPVTMWLSIICRKVMPRAFSPSDVSPSRASSPPPRVLDAASGGEREHPALAPSGDQGAADLVAVHAWQVAVQHDHVVAVDRGAVQGGLAIPRHIGGYALAAQHAGNRLGQLLMIFDEQYPHRCLPLAGV